MIIKDGGGRMEGKLSWLDDRQQLAIKTSQGWREVQLGRIIDPPELSLSTSLTSEDSHQSAQNWLPEDQFSASQEDDELEDNNEVTEDILDLSDHAKRKMHGYRQHGVTPANKNKWFHGVTADTENSFDGEGLDLPPDMSMGQNPQIGYPYSPIVHGPKWFPSKLRMIALNEPQSGLMGGINKMNYECHRQASRAGLRGSFRAFLASELGTLESIIRFGDRNLPLVNLKGDILYENWQEMFQNQRLPGFTGNSIYSFSGLDVANSSNWPTKSLWHGHGLSFDTSGSAPTATAPPGTCRGWHSDSALEVGFATNLLDKSASFLAAQRVHCNDELAVLCVEWSPPTT